MAPTESSVYSQQHDSYEPSNRRGRPPIASSIYDDISPPDSPKGYETKNSGDVSPIERDLEADIHPAFRIHNKPSYSNLPVRKPTAVEIRKPVAGEIRKPSAGDKDAPSRAYKRDPSQPLRWDKYSGEPTTSGKGIPSGVKPTSVVEVLEKKKQLRKTAETARVEEPILVDIRPPWKGASGRTTLVEPVADKPRERVPVPRRELNNRPSVGPPISSSPPPAALHGAETRHAGRVQSNREAAASTSTIHKATEERPTTPDVLGGWVDEQPTPKATPTLETPPVRGPDSRFSWTTQATNTTYQHSEPPSPPPPLPALPAINTIGASSIMNRSRPIPSRNYSPGPDSPVISTPPLAAQRKPLSGADRPARTSSRVLPGGLASPASALSPTSSNSGAAGGGKALPPVPGAVNAADHVATLQARLDDLATQRGNVERVLRDLTDPAACNPLVSNFRVEREREKRVAALRDELNEIGLLEHEVGLRMHRAQRRKEREEGYEGFTTLWVRRVTE
jgi:hypothetical protein